MHFKTNKKIVVTAMLCMAMVAAQTFAQKEHDEKPKNLKVLPKDIGGEELHNMMRDFSKSLGVKCSYCHVSQDMGEGQRPKFDFAADDKPEKGIAREMIKMVSAINSNYLAQIKDDHKLETITCVTCHNGNIKPAISVESLPKK